MSNETQPFTIKVEVEAAMSSYAEAESCCGLCKKEFISETALKNHAKSEHFEVYSQGDPDKWMGIITQKQSANADLKAKAKNIVLIDSERLTISKETIISSMVPAPMTLFADLDVNFVILKEEEDNINPPVWKRNSRAKRMVESAGWLSMAACTPWKSCRTRDRLKSERKREYCCVLCNVQCLNARKLRMHIKKLHIVTGTPKEILCDICGSKYQSEKLLRLHHQRNHKGARNFTCSICQKGFCKSDVLRTHERIHSGERSYCCAVCGKTFTQKPALTRHEAVHTGAKPYVCQLCNKSYTQSHSLKIHVNRDHCTLSPDKEKTDRSNQHGPDNGLQTSQQMLEFEIPPY